MSFLTKRYVKNPDIEIRRLSGEMVLLPRKEEPDNPGEIYVLNGIGVRIWQLMEGVTIKKLMETLLEEYEVSPEELETDLRQFLSKLEHIGLVSIASGNKKPVSVPGNQTP